MTSLEANVVHLRKPPRETNLLFCTENSVLS